MADVLPYVAGFILIGFVVTGLVLSCSAMYGMWKIQNDISRHIQDLDHRQDCQDYDEEVSENDY